MPKRTDIKKVLMIGSGPIQIGQAAEFDFSGSQACRALREEGINIVLVNSNPATIMTDPEMADEIYIEPLRADVIAKIIEKERPDGILSGMGGQTALNLTVELAEMGALENVEILGTPLEAIYKGEDREKFRDLMTQIGEPVPRSTIINSLSQIDEAIRIIGLPAVVRPAYTLGGAGGGIGKTKEELIRIVELGLCPFTDPPGADRGECSGLEGDRIRGDAGCFRYLYYRLWYGKCGPYGHSYRRKCCCCPDPHPP